MITTPGQFWKTKSLEDMTPVEWELLCDNCGRCCLQKMRDGDSGKIKLLAISCEYLDISTCRCLVYENRKRLKPDCVKLSPKKLTEAMEWLPDTCAYRKIAAGKELDWWHPLVSGDPNTVHQAKISVRDKIIPGWNLKLEQLNKILL